MEYLPKRYSANAEQENARQIVYDFKDGYCSTQLKQQIVSRIKDIMNIYPYEDWEVCFIPASTHMKSVKRYTSLCEYIKEHTSCTSHVNTISTIHDEEAGHISGKKNNPEENFEVDTEKVRGKSIILIDDVITRGRTFCNTADKLSNNGASRVVGLFVAKTVHPE